MNTYQLWHMFSYWIECDILEQYELEYGHVVKDGSIKCSRHRNNAKAVQLQNLQNGLDVVSHRGGDKVLVGGTEETRDCDFYVGGDNPIEKV